MREQGTFKEHCILLKSCNIELQGKHGRNILILSPFLNVSSQLLGRISENSLMVQWLGLHAFTAEGIRSIPGEGTEIPQAVWCSPKKPLKSQKARLGMATVHLIIPGLSETSL